MVSRTFLQSIRPEHQLQNSKDDHVEALCGAELILIMIRCGWAAMVIHPYDLFWLWRLSSELNDGNDVVYAVQIGCLNTIMTSLPHISMPNSFVQWLMAFRLLVTGFKTSRRIDGACGQVITDSLRLLSAYIWIRYLMTFLPFFYFIESVVIRQLQSHMITIQWL